MKHEEAIKHAEQTGGLYPTRYHAMRERTGNDVVVKVCGGYKIMDPRSAAIWAAQK